MKVACNVNNCAYYSSGNCCAQTINVGGKTATKAENTCCGSFLDVLGYSHLNNSCTTSGVCENIICNVGSCEYHSGNTCTASNVSVGGNHANLYSETNCSTFKLK